MPIITNVSICDIFDSKLEFENLEITPTRKVHEYEVELFLQNSGTMFLNDKSYSINRGDILFAKPKDIRRSKLPFSCYFIRFLTNDTNIISVINNIPCYTKNLDFEKYYNLFYKLSKSLTLLNEYSQLLSLSILYELLFSINFDLDNLTLYTPLYNQPIIATAKQYINENLTNNITIKDIAEHCHISEAYLYKLFQKGINMSPHDYLLNQRLSFAISLIKTSNLSINEIAFRSGFNSQAHFCNCFKKKYNVSPKEYRSKYPYDYYNL